MEDLEFLLGMAKSLVAYDSISTPLSESGEDAKGIISAIRGEVKPSKSGFLAEIERWFSHFGSDIVYSEDRAYIFVGMVAALLVKPAF